jgi:hypothetical protein
MSLNPWVAGAAALVATLAVWHADHSALVRNSALAALKESEDANTALVSHYNRINTELYNRTELLTRLGAIERGTQQLRTVVQGQGEQINRNLLELKRNDKAVADYLALPVPAALGVRYARPASIDPTAWRAAAAAGVQPGALSAASPAGGGSD